MQFKNLIKCKQFGFNLDFAQNWVSLGLNDIFKCLVIHIK